MKKSFWGTILLVLAIIVPLPTIAGVNVNIGIALPPPIVFQAPPDVIAMPETTGVYVVPDISEDVYFWDGFWWRLWEGRWYRSAYYNRNWVYYDNVPSFYFDVDTHWREYYRNHNWYGHEWNYHRIPYQRLEQNWRSWQTKRYWGGQKTWGVQGYPPRTQQHKQVLRQQRQQQYQQRPEVQRHQQKMREQQRRPQSQQGQGKSQNQKSHGGSEQGEQR